MKHCPYLLPLILLFCGCNFQNKPSIPEGLLFTRLTSGQTGIQFINQLDENDDFDVFRYRNYYNGGGVAIGDINNDGLPDIYLTSNRGENKLYLNLGDFKFEDITASAKVGGTKPWATGVSMADVNGDGLLDIYVCNSGDLDGKNMENELFINNGDGTFTEMAKEYGLDDPGFSTHAVFFDYDGDGDLDCYLLNNSFRPISTLGFKNLRNQRDPKGGDKLYKNEKGKFIDVSEQAGIYGSVIGFGLGVSVGDINGNGLPDLFISNDFYERDYLYINQGDGTFEESLTDYMEHISMFSMGADIADINNDGFPEIFTTDMLPESDRRLKTMAAFETYDVLQLRLQNDYYYQYMRNTLQLNNQGESFSEIGYLANVAATDWSWGALIADLNNNGKKDIFVSNGVYKDVTNQDFVEYLASNENMRAAIEGKQVNFKDFIDKMPSEKLVNYVFTQDQPLRFRNVAQEWGFGEPSFSNGAAYGDLDGDGDLDLVINNVNQEVFIYRNNTEEKYPDHNFLTFNFSGYGKNLFGLGAKVSVYANGEIFSYENMPIRGFQSSMDYKMVIGLGEINKIDSVTVRWPDGKQELLYDLALNQNHTLNHENATEKTVAPNIRNTFFEELPDQVDFIHQENDYNDFDRERLLFKMLSTEGPAFAVADINGDGLEDFYIGGAKDQSGAIYLQKPTRKFQKLNIEDLENQVASEDIHALFFDANNNGRLDLLIVSGGSEFTSNSPQLKDRLYLNEYNDALGNPVYKESKNALPNNLLIGSKSVAWDINGDGHLDLFIASRKNNNYYGLAPTHQILINDGTGKFEDQTKKLSPDLNDIGMITDASLVDLHNDGNETLLLIGDWNEVMLLEKENGKLVKKNLSITNLKKSNGWWNTIKIADLNNDGLPDIILGNTGLNSRLRASQDHPISLYVNDFDKNGSYEQVHTYHKNGKDYPIHTRHDMVKQMSFLKKKFITYHDYAEKSVEEIFEKEILDKSRVLSSHIGESIVLINKGNGDFEKVDLPIQAQFTTIRGIEVMDINKDGHLDILLAGNFYGVKPELGRYDASSGVTLLGDGKGKFSYLPQNQSGFSVHGQTRHLHQIQSDSSLIIAIRNNDSPKIFKLK